MNRVILRILLVSVALILILLLLLRTRSPFGKINSSFAPEPQDEITKIEFSSADKKLSLEKVDDKWLINGESEARKSGILFITGILEDMKIKSPVSDELFTNEITSKGIEPVFVRVYEKRKLLKSFYVYKTQSNLYGNIMKIKGRSKPFIVHVPGFEGDIGSGFTLNELFWQPYLLFNMLPSEIASVSLENLADTAASFSIQNSNHHFVLSGTSGELTGWDSSRVNRYLSYFTYIPFEEWAFEMEEKERGEVESRQPLYRISVKSRSGVAKVLTLWERTIPEGVNLTIDSDRLLGKTEESELFFVIRYFDIDPLLKKRSYFFPQ